MVGRKTHEQQLRVIEGRENTRNGGDDPQFEEDLKSSPAAREARREGAALRSPPEGGMTDPDDRGMIDGRNQESRHRKDRPD